MKGEIFDIMSGSVLSFIPLYIVSKYYFENDINKNQFDYIKYVKYLPVKMALLNLFLFLVINKISPNSNYDFVILGATMSVVISMFTKSYNDIPEKVVKSNNNNLYHLYITIVFIIAYYFIILARNNILNK
jgi:hypothetical protein